MVSYLSQVCLHMLPYIMVFTLLPSSLAMPKHQFSSSDYSYEDPSIPVHLLRIPMQVDIRPTEIQDFPDFSGSSNKRASSVHLYPDQQVNSCCPTNREIVEPIAGKNRGGDLVELYQTESVRQRFYEISCAPSVANKHCHYLDEKHQRRSRCEQQYSYTYALVRDMVMDGSRTDRGWRLDYILVRSGCSCQIAPAPAED